MSRGQPDRPFGHGGPAARLEELFRRHYRAVAAYVARRAPPEVVDDVVAETFLVAWRRLDDIPDQPLPWLLGVARKIMATQRRAARRRRLLVTKLSGADVQPTTTGFGGDPIGVREALNELSAKDREAVTLVAWDGLAPNEAAAVLDESAVVFRVRLHRARRRLREKLERREQVDAYGLVLPPSRRSTHQEGNLT